MSRKNLIRTNLYPYHVTSRTHNKEVFPIPLERVWTLAKLSIQEAYIIYPVDIVSFVLMDNHYHLMLFTPMSNIDKFLYEFNKRLAMKIHRESGEINQVFGGRYKWCLIQTQNYFKNCYRYIYQNPIRASIVGKCEDYPFSTLNYYKNMKSFCVPVYHDDELVSKEGIQWMNARVDSEESSKIKKGLYRLVFKD